MTQHVTQTFQLLQPPAGTSFDTFQNVIAGASAAYAIKKHVPSVEEIAQYCRHKPSTISRVIVTPEFKKLMELRGMPFGRARLSPEQYFAVSILTDPTNKKPMAAKLKQAGITYPIYRGWLKQPHFKEYIEKISEDMLGEHIGDVHTNVLNQATNGNLAAAKMIYELTGRHDPNKQQMVDLNGVIGLLLEIITRYVTDVGQLSKITSDIETVMSGGIPKALEQFDVQRIADNSDSIDVEDAVVVEDIDPILISIGQALGKPIGSAFIQEKGIFDE